MTVVHRVGSNISTGDAESSLPSPNSMSNKNMTDYFHDNVNGQVTFWGYTCNYGSVTIEINHKL
jgi:hypothetical protein